MANMTPPILRRKGGVLREHQTMPTVIVRGGGDLLARYRMAVLVRTTRGGIPLVGRGGGVGAVGAQEQGQGVADHCSSSYRSYRFGKGGILGLRGPHWPYAMQGSLTMG